ncbi:MAG: response regulator transcription factor [Nitrospirae bacterium]|nr:response regulator transcription factor [Nitrospirota bacterium]
MEKKSILLVEDDMQIRESTKLIIETKYHVLEASDYDEAIAELKNPLDLAIIDYILPDYDGFDLLKEIRKVKPSLPVIMMTGYGTEQVAMRALRMGATDYIKKPLDIPYLMNKISELLGEDTDIKNDVNYLNVAKNRDEIIIDGIARYIEQKYKENLTRDKLADIAGMNEYKFCRAFKKRIGQSFISYLNGIRIKNTAELLKNPDLSITEVAHRAGYGSVEHFERVFKKRYEMSPREYRRKLNRND